MFIFFSKICNYFKFSDVKVPFLDLALHNPASINIDNMNYSFEIDTSGSANYYMNSELDAILYQKEVPF